MFAQFCGMLGPQEEWSIDELNLFLFVLSESLKESINRSEDEENRIFITMDRAEQIIQQIFEPSAIDALKKSLTSISEDNHRIVDVDHFLELVTMQVRSRVQAMEEQLFKIFAQEPDTEPDSQNMTVVFDEFVGVVKKVNPSKSFSEREVYWI